MKKLLIPIYTVAAMLVLTNCDKKDPVTPTKESPDNLSVVTTKETEEIRTYTATNYGAFTFRINASDPEFPNINNLKLKTKILPLEGSGTFKINNVNFPAIDTSLLVNTNHMMKYYPSGSTNMLHKFVMIVDNGHGRILKDTMEYMVHAYEPVGFTVTVSPKDFGSVQPNGSFAFKVQISSSDISGLMKYYIDYSLPNASQATVSKSAVAFPSGSQAAIGDNWLTVQMNNHTTGIVYKIPLVIRDQNGDFKRDTIRYNVFN